MTSASAGSWTGGVHAGTREGIEASGKDRRAGVCACAAGPARLRARRSVGHALHLACGRRVSPQPGLRASAHPTRPAARVTRLRPAVQALGWSGSTAGSRGRWAGGPGVEATGPGAPLFCCQRPPSLPDSQVWGARADSPPGGRQGLGGFLRWAPDGRAGPGARLGDMERETWALRRLKRPGRNAVGLPGYVQSRKNNADAYGLFFWANVEIQNVSLLRSSSES